MKTNTILSAEGVFFEGFSGGEMRMLYPGIHPGLMLFEEIAERDLWIARERNGDRLARLAPVVITKK